MLRFGNTESQSRYGQRHASRIPTVQAKPSAIRQTSVATTLTGYIKGAGAAAFTASATIPSTDITGLGTIAAQAASNVAITGGTIDNITLDGGTF